MRKLIEDYQNIKAEPEFRERIEKTMARERRKEKGRKIMKWSVSTAACVIIAGVVSLNAIPSAAYALSDVPVIGQIIKVVTLGRYENDENGYHADIKTPKIEGLLDKKLEDKLNSEFRENADALIAAYEKDVKEMKKEFGDETIHMGVESDYTVRTDNDNVLALDVYIFNVAGSSSTKHTFYNIDKKSGKLLELKDLFKKDADYITPISAYIKEEMKKENTVNDGLFWTEDDEFTEGFKNIKADQNFYINNDNRIVICFDKYEVAAGAQGCPEFEIPDSVVKDIRSNEVLHNN